MNKKIYLFIIGFISSLTFSNTVHAAPAITQFSAWPLTVKAGDPSTITWATTQLTDGCTNFGTSFYGWNAGGGGLDAGSQTIYPGLSRTYSIRCSEDVTSRTAGPITINVNPNPPAALQFDTTAVSITAGAPVTMTWSTVYATSCTGTGTGFTSPGTSGPLNVYPSTSMTYSLQCTGPGGASGTYNKVVTVTPSASVSASPTSIVSGNSSLITWNSVGATSCTGSNFNTGGLTSGSVSVSPTSNTIYSMSCISADGHTGFSNVQAVTVTAPPAINASCSVSPTTANTGQNVTWNATASGGTPPYSYDWTGSGNLVGSGISQVISYATAGLKYASIKVTDSSMNLTPWAQVHTANRRCSGASTGISYWQAVEDGGTQAESQNTTHEAAAGSFWDPSWGTPPPGAFYTNPENYCVEEDVRIYGCTSICTFGQNVKLYSGSGTRAVNGGDPLNHVYATETVQPSIPTPTPKTVTMACTNNVNVSVALPTATLSAAPVSVVSGNSSTLTWSCSNSSTSAVIDNGVGAVTPASGGSIAVSPLVTTTYQVTCTNASGSANASVSVNVTPAPSDLTPTAGAPVTITAGQSYTYTAGFTNIGSGSTVTGFQNTIILYYADQITWIDWNTSVSGALAPGISGTASYTTASLTTPGTYYYRICTDLGAPTWAGTIPESNEGNNCSGFSTITVTAAIPPSPTGLTNVCNAAGTQATISWNATPGADNYYVRVQDTVTSAINPYLDLFVPVSTTFTTIPGRNYSWWVHSNNVSGYSAPTYGYFNCTGQADLTSVTGSPTAATAGVSQTYTGTITNNGILTTGAGFTTLLQVCDAGCASYNNRTTVATGALVPTASVGVSKADTISSAGTYYYRFCADNNASWVGTIAESDETNNCGAWSSIVVSPIVLSCTVNTTNPAFGFPAIYTASPGSAAPYTWDDALGGSYGTTNSATRNFPPTGGDFAMSVQGNNTTVATCPMVHYDAACAVTSSATITATPSRVKKGSSSSIAWSIDRAPGSSCVVSGPGISYTSPTIPTCIGPIPLDETLSSPTPPITSKAVYNIVCNGLEVASTTVNLIPTFNEF